MRQSKARYKVYLHEDVLIVNRHFLRDILTIFRNPHIGLIGMCGAKAIPPSGLWWEYPETFGQVYHPDFSRILAMRQPQGLYEVVACIDGFIMITQYDLPWREDIIDGLHFYDLSHCMEFPRRGYQIAVPQQNKPWCCHISGGKRDAEFYRLRQDFLKEYLWK